MSELQAPVLFVSHHSSKLETAEHVERALNAKGVQCWIAPRDIEPGEQWDVAIRKAIADSDAMLLLFCSSSEKSRQVKRELILADQLGKAIIPLRLERIDPGQLSYHLADSQWVDWLEQRDGVIDRIAAKAREFQGTDAFEPSSPIIAALGPSLGAPPGDAAVNPAMPISFDKPGQAAPASPSARGEPAAARDPVPAFAADAAPGGAPSAFAGPAAPRPPSPGEPAARDVSRKSLLWLWLTLGGLVVAGLAGFAIWFFALRGPPPITERWFAGQWADTPDCNEIFLFEDDGDLVTPQGGQGTWRIEDGTTLVIEGSDGTVRRRIERVAEDEVDSSDGPAYRCG